MCFKGISAGERDTEDKEKRFYHTLITLKGNCAVDAPAMESFWERVQGGSKGTHLVIVEAMHALNDNAARSTRGLLDNRMHFN